LRQPRIIPAIYVKPFVKEQKNDYNDAEAIAEAALRPRPPASSLCFLGATVAVRARQRAARAARA
jgi:hypothetical protein